LSKRSMPGTAADTLPNSSALSRLLAKANSAPAPPRACGRVIESCFVNCPTSSELEPVGATDSLGLDLHRTQDKKPAQANRGTLGQQSMCLGYHFRPPRAATNSTAVTRTALIIHPSRCSRLLCCVRFVREGLASPTVHLPINVVTSP
jgi:hypothetical protein